MIFSTAESAEKCSTNCFEPILIEISDELLLIKSWVTTESLLSHCWVTPEKLLSYCWVTAVSLLSHSWETTELLLSQCWVTAESLASHCLLRLVNLVFGKSFFNNAGFYKYQHTKTSKNLIIKVIYNFINLTLMNEKYYFKNYQTFNE